MKIRQPSKALASVIALGILAALFVSFVSDSGLPKDFATPVDAPSTNFVEIDSAEIAERIDKTTTDILAAFNRRDQAAYLSHFADKPIVLAEGADLFLGRADMAQMYLRSPDGIIYEPMDNADRRFFVAGNWIIETQLVSFNFRLGPDTALQRDPRQSLTIWERDDTDELKVKLLSWNRLGQPQALKASAAPVAFEADASKARFSADGDFSEALEQEELFHRSFQTKNPSKAAGFYADGAVLIVGETLPIFGKYSIYEYLSALPPDMWAASVEREVARVEGNGNHVLVINLFRWKFQPSGSDSAITVLGKGVHFWERQEDGEWLLLFDLPNATRRI